MEYWICVKRYMYMICVILLISRHMFHFDIDQPMVLYTASDSGKIHRVDLRIAQSINRDMFVDGTSNNNSNSSGGDVIFCNYMTSGKPNSASNLGSVKALTQSSSLGSSQLFVGGVGYAIGLLDMRMNIDASSHVQNMLLHGRISTCSKRKSKESLLTPTTTPFVAPSAVTVPVAPSARSTAANISSPDRVEHDQVSDSDRDDSDSDEVSDSTSVGTMMNTIDALVVRANQGDEGAQRQAIAICRRVGIDPGDMMQNRPLFEAMNSNPAAMLEQLYPGGVGLQGDLTNLARQIARTANGDDDEEDSDGDVAPANPVAVAVSGATLPSALASAFRSTKMLKKAKNQETETLDVMDEIRSVLFVKMYGPHFIEPVSGVSAAMDKSAIRSGAGRSARYGGSARLYPDDPLADSDTDCESDEDPKHIPGEGTTSDGNYAKKLLIKLSDKADAVSISGMQCSKNGQLLLASYQGDQIYTFNVNDVPVGDSHSHCKGREYTDIMCSENGVGNSNIREQGCSSNYHDPSDSLSYENWNSHTRRLLDYGLGKGVGARTVIGGHINYATFLKTVSFYGPRDEYIVVRSSLLC